MNKICPNCQAEIQEDNKFCTECGHSLVSEGPVGEQVNGGEATKTVDSKPISFEINLSSVNPIMKHYWQLFLTTIKSPSKGLQLEKSTFGWVQFIVLILLNSLASVVMAKQMSYSASIFSLFFSAIVLQAIIIALALASIYIVSNYLKKEPVTFTEVASKFGGLLSPNVVLAAGVLLFLLLNIYNMVILFMMLSFMLYIFAFNIYLYSIPNNQKIDTFYLTLVGNAIFMVFMYLISRMFFDLFFQDIVEMYMRSIFW